MEDDNLQSLANQIGWCRTYKDLFAFSQIHADKNKDKGYVCGVFRDFIEDEPRPEEGENRDKVGYLAGELDAYALYHLDAVEGCNSGGEGA